MDGVVFIGGVTVFARTVGCGWTVVAVGGPSRRRVSRDVVMLFGESGITVRVVVVVVVPILASLPLGEVVPVVVRVTVPCGVVPVVVLRVALGGTCVTGSLTTVTFSARLIRVMSAGLAMILRVG